MASTPAASPRRTRSARARRSAPARRQLNPFAGPFTPGTPTEFDFGGSSGPCVAPYAVPVLDPVRIDNLRRAHSGLFASAYGGCLGADYGDNIARGYITVDR